MIVLSPILQSLLTDRVHRFCTLWQLTVLDGRTYRFTNHNVPIFYANHTYTPAGGFEASARQKTEGLKDRNWEAKGITSDDKFSFGEMLAGRFRQAKVQEHLIDWRYPWTDPFESHTYWIVNIAFTSEGWTAQMEGLTHRLKQSVGRVYSRMCDVFAFGDSRCNVAGGEAAFTETGKTITGINAPRQDFETDLTQTTNYYKRGYMRFTSGANDGLTMEINKSYGTGGRLTLWLPMPYAVEIGDTFSIVAGCNRTLATCQTKFSNAVNFRGFPFISGTDAMFVTPNFHVAP